MPTSVDALLTKSVCQIELALLFRSRSERNNARSRTGPGAGRGARSPSWVWVKPSDTPPSTARLVGLRRSLVRQEPKEELFDAIESTNSMRFTGDMGTTGNGASGLPQETTDPESSSWRNNPYVNGIGGFAVGLLEGIVPGAALGYGIQDALGEHDGMMRQARIGRSLGQMIGGAITAGIGLAGEAAATGFVLTGVGSVVGVPVAVVSTAAVASGAANFLAGFQGLAKQLTGGGATRGPPSGGGNGTTVYSSVNGKGQTQYVGITKNFEQRANAQHREKGIAIKEIQGLNGLSRSDARAVEQVLIEYHGLGKGGGTLMNKINSIAQTNPVYADSLRRGAELLKAAGYAGF